MDLEGNERFDSLDLELISVMADPAYKLTAEVESRSISTIVASDTTLRASKDYGALGKSMHPGIKPGHTFILVGAGGTILWRWDWTEDKGEMYLDVETLNSEVRQALDAASSGVEQPMNQE